MRIVHPIARLARTVPDRLALSDTSHRLTYGELDRLIRRAAMHLRSLGVERGARVAISAPNSIAWVALAHACARLGAVSVPVHTRSSTTERERLMMSVAPKMFLTEDGIVSRDWGPEFDTDASTIPDTIELDDTSAIIATSGSSGEPKYVCLTNRNFYFSALASSIHLGHRADDCWLLNLPLCHVGGLSILHRAAVAGFAVMVQAGFDAEMTMRAIADRRVTHLSLVPTTLSRLLDEAGSTHFPDHVRAVLVGGGPSSPELLDRARAMGLPVLPTYGLTEASSQVATFPPRNVWDNSGTAGRPLPFAEVEIRSGREASTKRGVSGPVWIRGPMVARQYWTDTGPVSTLDEDGWFETSDIGNVDAAGLLHLIGRSDDVIVSGGENISLLEIENALAACEGVTRAAVIPVNDDEWGQTPVAFVTTTAPASVRADQLTAALQKRLGSHKLPKRIIVLDQMPETTIGKVDRRVLLSLVRNEKK